MKSFGNRGFADINLYELNHGFGNEWNALIRTEMKCRNCEHDLPQCFSWQTMSLSQICYLKSFFIFVEKSIEQKVCLFCWMSLSRRFCYTNISCNEIRKVEFMFSHVHCYFQINQLSLFFTNDNVITMRFFIH